MAFKIDLDLKSSRYEDEQGVSGAPWSSGAVMINLEFEIGLSQLVGWIFIDDQTNYCMTSYSKNFKATSR